jgi:hypothetical protein
MILKGINGAHVGKKIPMRTLSIVDALGLTIAILLKRSDVSDAKVVGEVKGLATNIANFVLNFREAERRATRQ